MFFNGEYIHSDFLPYSYIFTWILITTPILYIILFLIGYFVIFRRFFLRFINIMEKSYYPDLWRGTDEKKDLFVLFNLTGVILGLIVFSIILYTGWRQIYFLNIFIISNKSGKNLITIYSYTVLKMIKPKIVITSIDNHGQFSDLARLLDDEIQFLAVQNANRHDFATNLFEYENRIAKKNINNDLYLPHYFCFGQLEIDDCNLYKINVKNFYKYGSIGVANFFHYLNQKKIKLNNIIFSFFFILLSIHHQPIMRFL